MAGTSAGKHRRSKYVSDDRILYRIMKNVRIEMGEFSQSNVNGAPMHVSADLPRQDGDMRPVQGSDRSRSHRRLNVEKGQRQVHAVKHVDFMGMRMSTALVALLVVGLGLMFINLYGLTKVSDVQKDIARLEESVEVGNKRVADLQQKYQNATANTHATEMAREMGMVSSKSVPATELELWEDVEYMPSSDSLVLPADTLAAILGN